MKIAIVPVSMMVQQLQVWEWEREIEEMGRLLERQIENAKATRRRRQRKIAQLSKQLKDIKRALKK